ncbi:MAG: GntR family transcriptional regulator [Pseudonocardiaceae bacterium]
MTIDPTDPRPAYQQVADQLRTLIYGRELAPGDRLPSERELVERYGLAHGTVRQAIEVLRSEGLVVSVQGRGSFVRKAPLIHRYAPKRYQRSERPPGARPLQAEAEAQGQTQEQRLLEVGPVAPPGEVASRLGVGMGEQVLVRRHLLLVEDTPIQTADSYFPLALVEGTRVAENARIEGGVHAALEDDLGLQLEHFVEELRSRTPTPEEARLLHLRPGETVIKLLRTLVEMGGRPIEVSDFTFAGDKHVLVYQVPVH